MFVAWLIDFHPNSKRYIPEQDEIDTINLLAETKYKTWQWNFGYSPAYTFLVDIPITTGILPVRIKVENGKFVQIDLLADAMNERLYQTFINMTGLLHNEEEIEKFVKNNLSSLELAGVNIVNFVRVFFR